MKKQTKSHLLRLEDKSIFKEIKGLLKAQDYIECGICGAVKVDAKKCARALHLLNEKYFDKDDDKADIFDQMMWEIIEYEPEFEEHEDFFKWFEANEDRLCDFLDSSDYGSQMYIIYSEVVLFSDEKCECLKVW